MNIINKIGWDDNRNVAICTYCNENIFFQDAWGSWCKDFCGKKESIIESIPKGVISYEADPHHSYVEYKGKEEFYNVLKESPNYIRYHKDRKITFGWKFIENNGIKIQVMFLEPRFEYNYYTKEIGSYLGCREFKLGRVNNLESVISFLPSKKFINKQFSLKNVKESYKEEWDNYHWHKYKCPKRKFYN